MITCEHAQQLFDRYLDGELSPSLQAELHAHQLSCGACQNDLALLEACGDVIMLDRRHEPQLSDSFTDRVMLARRAQVARRPRSWGRAAVVVASPIAAAASVLLAVTLMIQSASQQTTSIVGGKTAALPTEIEEFIGGGENQSQEALRELINTPRMSTDGFMKKLLQANELKEGESVDGARGGLNGFEMLLHGAWSEIGDKLTGQRQQSNEAVEPEVNSSDSPVLLIEPEFLNRLGLEESTTSEESEDVVLDPA